MTLHFLQYTQKFILTLPFSFSLLHDCATTLMFNAQHRQCACTKEESLKLEVGPKQIWLNADLGLFIDDIIYHP